MMRQAPFDILYFVYRFNSNLKMKNYYPHLIVIMRLRYSKVS